MIVRRALPAAIARKNTDKPPSIPRNLNMHMLLAIREEHVAVCAKEQVECCRR